MRYSPIDVSSSKSNIKAISFNTGARRYITHAYRTDEYAVPDDSQSDSNGAEELRVLDSAREKESDREA